MPGGQKSVELHDKESVDVELLDKESVELESRAAGQESVELQTRRV